MRVPIASPFVHPSPNGRTVGIRIDTFELSRPAPALLAVAGEQVERGRLEIVDVAPATVRPAGGNAHRHLGDRPAKEGARSVVFLLLRSGHFIQLSGVLNRLF